MADAVVTDTHPLIFHAAGGAKLGRRARAIFDRCERQKMIVYVPIPVIWECGLLARAGRIVLGRSLRVFCDDLFSNPAYQPLDMTAEHAYVADELRFTRDPFDALICATARTMGLALITRDEAVTNSGAVRTIW